MSNLNALERREDRRWSQYNTIALQKSNESHGRENLIGTRAGNVERMVRIHLGLRAEENKGRLRNRLHSPPLGILKYSILHYKEFHPAADKGGGTQNAKRIYRAYMVSY